MYQARQKLIRKEKSKIKEKLDEKKIVSNYTLDISTDTVITTKIICGELGGANFIYDMPKITYTGYFIDDIKACAEDGLISIYEAEMCNFDWILSMFNATCIYKNFLSIEKVNINSLYIVNSCSPISAMHHFIFNSHLRKIQKNIEWNWSALVDKDKKLSYSDTAFFSKYKDNILNILSNGLHHEINYIINEVAKKHNKLNFIYIDRKYVDIKEYICYGILAIKLLDAQCIFCISFPFLNKWTKDHISAIILYCLIFKEVYLYNLNMEDNQILIVAKNKKKFNAEIVFKKLFVTLSTDLNKYNLFDMSGELQEIYKKITHISWQDLNKISIDEIIKEILTMITLNEHKFL